MLVTCHAATFEPIVFRYLRALAVVLSFFWVSYILLVRLVVIPKVFVQLSLWR
jgi:hypothetical protein